MRGNQGYRVGEKTERKLGAVRHSGAEIRRCTDLCSLTKLCNLDQDGFLKV